MTFGRPIFASLLLLSATACSSGGDSGGSMSPSGGSSGGTNGSDASNVDGTTGASSSSGGSSGGSSGASTSSGGIGDGGSSGGGDSGCVATYDGGPLSDGGPGAAAGGASAVAAYFAAACNRADTCGVGQNDAGGCVSDGVAYSNIHTPLAPLERADYLSSLTSCIGSADCTTLMADGGFTSAVSACSVAAFTAIPQDTALTSLCQTISCLSCVSAQHRDFQTCLATYGNLNDGTLLALNTCLSSNFCSDPDAGASCERMALTPH